MSGKTSSCRTAKCLISGEVTHASKIFEHPQLIAEPILPPSRRVKELELTATE
jgi:hypothetical protein